ncbi:holin [Rhodococcus sp. P27]|nr:holin [Rhodococcus sp. P27]
MGYTNKTAQEIANYDPGILDDLLRATLENQPWYRKWANTITTVIFALLNASWLLISTGIELPSQVVIGIAIVVLVSNILGVKMTKNGVTDSTAEQIKANVETYVGKHRA